MARTHYVYQDIALDKFSDTDPSQDAELFFEPIERKMSFAFGD